MNHTCYRSGLTLSTSASDLFHPEETPVCWSAETSRLHFYNFQSVRMKKKKKSKDITITILTEKYFYHSLNIRRWPNYLFFFFPISNKEPITQDLKSENTVFCQKHQGDALRYPHCCFWAMLSPLHENQITNLLIWFLLLLLLLQ